VPIRFTYDPDLRILFTTAEGLLTFAEIQKHLEEEHTQRALGYRELVDATNATTNVTSNEVRLLVAELQIMMPSTPFGPTSVVTTNDVLFGMAS